MTSFATLRGLAKKPEKLERCDLCGAGVAHEHQHLIDPAARRLVCACNACAILFYQSGETKYKRVPRDGRLLKDFQMSNAQWDSLLIPIGLAFFMQDSAQKRLAVLYPSPAGSMESQIPIEAWNDIVGGNSILKEMESDVEALLVNRLGNEPEYFIAPIDKCYQLVGLIRGRWRGLSGGPEVWAEIGGFFDTLRENARA